MSTDRQGISAGELGTPSYYDACPASHTQVCRAGALDRASRGPRNHRDDWQVIIRDALQFLADDPGQCLCSKPKGQRRRR